MIFQSLVLIGLIVSASAQCDPLVDGLVCTSCSGGPFCNGGSVAFDVECSAGQVCDYDSGECKPADEVSEGNCGCQGTTGTYADPYTPSNYVDCSTGEPVFKSCDAGQAYLETECVALPSCEGRPSGSYPLDTSCNSYVSCESSILEPNPDPELRSCSAGTYFDLLAEDTTDPCISDPTCDAIGEFAYAIKCNMFYSCYAVGDTPVYHCCPENQNYDETTRQCVDGKGSCDRIYINACKEEEAENMYCNYCVNHEIGYKYATFLGKSSEDGVTSGRYFECVEVNGALTAQLGLCDEGQVFNPETSQCEATRV